jgi:hypothetical protein
MFPARADDMDAARLRGQRGMGYRRRWHGEIKDCPRPRRGFQQIILDDHADRRAAHRLPDIEADPGVARALHRAGKGGGGVVDHGLDQHPAHVARGADDGHWNGGHGRLLAKISATP